MHQTDPAPESAPKQPELRPEEGPSFLPVPVRARHDGWRPAVQAAFIHALAHCGCVDEACRAVRRSRASAYALRARPDADSFRSAWDAALQGAMEEMADAATSRAIHGVSRPIFYRGTQVGERRHYNDRLAIFLLRTRDPARFGGAAGAGPRAPGDVAQASPTSGRG